MRTVFSGLAAVLLLVNVSFAQEVIFEQGPNCPCPQPCCPCPQPCPCPQQCDVCCDPCCDPCCERPLYQPCFDGCCNNCCDCCPCEPVLTPKKSCISDCFYLRVEYLQLDVGEDGDDSRDFLTNLVGTGTAILQNSNQVAYNDEAAIRYTFGVHMGDCGEHLEVRYLHTADDWGTSAGRSVTGRLDLRAGGAFITPGLTNREMEYQTLEANYWGAEKRISCRLHYQPMIGLRGIAIDEQLNIDGNDEFRFQSQGENRIFGVQYGSELTYEAYRCCNRRFELAVIGKGGVGINYHEADFSNTFNQVEQGRDDDLTFAQWAEVGAEGRLHFGRLMISGGYEFLLVNGLDLGGGSRVP